MRINATDITPGDIVWIANPKSSADRPTYAHRFVVAFRPRFLTRGKSFTLVGIASCNEKAFDPLSMVRLPHDPVLKFGHPRTGLRQKCAAHAGFTHALELEVVEGKSLLQVNCKPDVDPLGQRRHVSPSELQTILSVFQSYWDARIAQEKSASSPPPPGG